jgi:DNA-directed RNA polymerase subunit M/transcription elongation factor TFIIS
VPNWKKYKRWERVRHFAEKQMKRAYFQGGNCGVTCPKCKQPEWLSNGIRTKDIDDGTTLIRCLSCEHEWLTVFSPAGFIPIPKPNNNQ